jgi:hypothetical protein
MSKPVVTYFISTTPGIFAGQLEVRYDTLGDAVAAALDRPVPVRKGPRTEIAIYRETIEHLGDVVIHETRTVELPGTHEQEPR